MARIKDITGKKFGRLIVICLNGRSNRHVPVWRCLCSCGQFKDVRGDHLKSGHTKSCGCLLDETRVRMCFKHGGKGTRLWKIWADMRYRCRNENCRCYDYYGGRGISVCEEWDRDFETFRDWALANGYQDNLTIDRIDNNGNYCPENCQWLTKSENSRKMRTKS